MAARRLIAAAALIGFATSATASITVIGSTKARICYEAADRTVRPTAADIRNCDEALNEDALLGADVVATHVNRGILRLRRGDVDGAVTDFDTATRLDPNQPEPYLNKGAAMIRRDRMDEALRLFTIALDKNTPRPELAHYGRGVAFEATGDIPAAYGEYRRASQIDPDWEEPKAELRRFRIVSRK